MQTPLQTRRRWCSASTVRSSGGRLLLLRQQIALAVPAAAAAMAAPVPVQLPRSRRLCWGHRCKG